MQNTINGQSAVAYLSKLENLVSIHRKDNTDKFWSYRMRKGSQREFAFDPKTKTKLIVRLDLEPPKHPRISEVEKIVGKDISTALNRVFSGGPRTPRFKATIASEEGLAFLLQHLQQA